MALDFDEYEAQYDSQCEQDACIDKILEDVIAFVGFDQ